MKYAMSTLLAAALVVPGVAPAQQRGNQAPAATQQDTTRRPGTGRRFQDVVRDATHRPGFFDTYEKGDTLYLVIPKDRLGREFLVTTEIAQGVGTSGLFGGTMLNIFEASLMALERHGSRVFLLERPHRFTAPAGSPAAAAVNLSFSSSVLESARIESIRDDSALVINVFEWFVSDLSNISQRVRGAVATGPGQPPPVTFERSRSFLEAVQSFPQNLNVRTKLTFRPQNPAGFNSVPDGRYIPVSIHYTLAALPESPMAPRLADDRIGFFLTVQKDFSRDDSTFFVRYVNRWRLEPGRPADGGLVEPKQPIVYYLDRNIPEAYRPFMKAGVEEWNRAFEAAGWKNAIRAELLPEGADPADIRYHTLRWNTSDEPGYGAIGPSMVDPRTGEILDADILFEANMVLGWKSNWRNLVSPAVALEAALGVSQEDLEAAASGAEYSTFGAMLAAQGDLLRTMLMARGELEPNAPVPMEFVGQALKWVTMHEVGHTLGLRHNFRSSYDTPLERLFDRGWAEQNGIYSSVMEYPAVNVAPKGTPNGYFWSPTVGTSDRWAISYGYTNDPAKATQIAREAALAGHAYGTDEDAGGPGAMDPLVSTFDMTRDPLAWSRQRTAVVASLWPDLVRNILTDNSRYADLTSAVNSLLGQYAQALGPAVKYIGGQMVYRDHLGDPEGRMPFVNVPKARQQEALTFLSQQAFSTTAFQLPRDILSRMGSSRWNHWGVQNTVDGRIDFPFHERVLGVQTSLINQLTNPFKMAKIRDAELRYGAANVVTVPELLGTLTRTIWSEAWTAPARNVPSMRRDLQRAYLDRLVTMVTTTEDRMPADARAVARMQLADLATRIRARLAPPAALDAYTTAHFTEARARIQKALDAGMDTR
jgi:uncharacterized protein DUF4953/uncharacterized protein DUF5117/uncharacterized protein DUF5118